MPQSKQEMLLMTDVSKDWENHSKTLLCSFTWKKKNWYLNDILRHSVNIENENKFLHRQVYNIFVLFTHYLQEFTILLQKKYVQNWKWP